MTTMRRCLGSRRLARTAAAALTACVLALACSEPTRQRVLKFFFDGVPEPGETQSKGYAPMGGAPSGPIAQAVAERGRAVLTVTHAPYRENQCDTCHNINTGFLFKTPQQGLCRTCHPDVPGAMTFVHGPVAVNECLFCHEPHGSLHAFLLVDEPTRLCLRCHRQEDLSDVPGHSEPRGIPPRSLADQIAGPDEFVGPQPPPAAQSCSDCHAAHGGEDRFFLRAAWSAITDEPSPAATPGPVYGPTTKPAAEEDE